MKEIIIPERRIYVYSYAELSEESKGTAKQFYLDGQEPETFQDIYQEDLKNLFPRSDLNIAAIEQTETFPYRGAGKKTSCFRLCLMAEYDDGFIYHISCYDSLADALLKLSMMSCGTFKVIE